jgi:hypothetical protein
MAEYSGFLGYAAPVDWSTPLSNAIEKISNQEKEREQQRQQLDKLAEDTQTQLKDFQSGPSKDFNTLVLQGADSGRNRILELNRALKAGQLTPSDYKMAVNRISSDWKNFSQFTKEYNGILSKQIDALSKEPDAYLQYISKRYASLADMDNVEFTMDPTTNSFLLYNKGTGQFADFRSELLPENFMPQKFDVIKESDEFTKTLGAQMRRNPRTGDVYTSALENPAYPQAKQAYIESIRSQPMKVASFLANNMGGYEFYETETQLSQIKDKSKAIKLSKNNLGVLEPQLTKSQLSEFDKAMGSIIDSQVERKVDFYTPKEQTMRQPTSSEVDYGIRQRKVADRRELLKKMVADPNQATINLKGLVMPDTGGVIEKVEFTTQGTGGSQDPNVIITYRERDPLDKNKFLPVAKTINRRSSQLYSVYNQTLNSGTKTDFGIEEVFEQGAPTPQTTKTSTKKKLPGT